MTGRNDCAGAIEIVGVCGDTRYSNLREDPPPQFILPYVQQPDVGGMVYEIHTQMKPEDDFAGAAAGGSPVDPDLPLVNVRTQQQQIEADHEQERIFVTLTSGFGMLALALACVGIYGIMAYSVANRRNEIGIRMALGAQPGQVRGMILRESTLAGGWRELWWAWLRRWLLTRLVKSMLYGIAALRSGDAGGGRCCSCWRWRWQRAGFRRGARRGCSRWRRCGTNRVARST